MMTQREILDAWAKDLDSEAVQSIWAHRLKVGKAIEELQSAVNFLTLEFENPQRTDTPAPNIQFAGYRVAGCMKAMCDLGWNGSLGCDGLTDILH